jgi:hypothetical protein
MAMLAALALGSVAAQAMSVNYQCSGRRPLKAELTPREGQIHFEGQDWTVKRVRSGREARYVNAKAGVEVVTKERTMTFTHGAETLQCFLKSDALPGDAPQKTR